MKFGKKYNKQRLIKKLQNELGPGFIVKNFEEQVPFLYKMVNTERIAVYFNFYFDSFSNNDYSHGFINYFYFTKKEESKF